MATPIILPRQGQSVESCIISRWHKKVGEPVKEGDLLFSYETDKASFDEEAKVSGYFLGAFFEEGDDVPCLLNVCAIGELGEDISSLKPVALDEEAKTPPEEISVAKSEVIAPQERAVGELFASPRAKMTAERLGIDPLTASPSGPNGRIIERDIIAMGKTISPIVDKSEDTTIKYLPLQINQEFTDVKLSNVRKVIARNMTASLQNMAQLTHHITFDATDILAFRAKLKSKAEALSLPNITLNDIILYAVSRTLKNHKDLNAHFFWDEGYIRHFTEVNLGIAVDTERGLLVPTLHNADSLSLSEISINAKKLSKEAQSGKIDPSLLSGATFTISNLGSFGIEMFTPVINPPQTGILGVNTLTTRVKDVGGVAVPYQAMGLSLTYDHRALDGAPASRFLKELADNLENFSLLLAK